MVKGGVGSGWDGNGRGYGYGSGSGSGYGSGIGGGSCSGGSGGGIVEHMVVMRGVMVLAMDMGLRRGWRQLLSISRQKLLIVNCVSNRMLEYY